MQVWRLCKRRHAAFDGEGARRVGGRWNRRGSPVVYVSSSLSLAALELLVHADPALLPDDLVAVDADLPAALRRREISERELPRGWRRTPPPEALADLGAAWLASRETAVLAVPSALVPHERNFLLNPAHEDFPRIRVGTAVAFSLDPRLMGRRPAGLTAG